MAPAIGIDLGTTFSRVAVFRHGKVEVIANEIGSRSTPSYVAFTDKGRLVGDAAKRQAAKNPKNTIFDVKRLIGRRLRDLTIQEDMKHWPFHVFESKGKTMLEATFKGEQEIFAPEEISAMVIGKMKDIAEKFLGTEVHDAVITVPAYFNDAQRQATKDAGTIAGLNVLRIINEPSAAALAYGLQNDLKKERNVLVYDLGGGTFDATVVTITNGSVFKVRSTSGNTHLGGEDFDRRIVQFLEQKFKEKHGKDLTGNPRAMSHLRAAAEIAKRDLSSSTTSAIDIDLLFEGIEFATHVSRKIFDERCLNLFEHTLEHVRCALADAKMDRKSIDDIVLVGGSTRIPKLQELLTKFFNGKELNLSINSDEAVVTGAAIQAAILSGERNPAIADFLLIDVNPLPLVLPGLNNQMFSLIERNTQVPFKTKIPFTYMGGRSVTNEVYEVEANYSFLCTFVVYDIPPNAQGTTLVNFELDTNGILQVNFENKKKLTSEKISVLKNNLLEHEIIHMAMKYKRYKLEEIREFKRVTERSSLESYIYEMKARVLNIEGDNGDDAMKDLYEKALKWLGANPHAANQEYEDMKKRLQAAEKKYHAKKMLGAKQDDGKKNELLERQTVTESEEN